MGGGKSYTVCKHTNTRDPAVHMHRFPSDKRQQWCEALGVQGKDFKSDATDCTRHFPNGDTSNLPLLTVGKRFAFPKQWPASCHALILPRKGQTQARKTLLECASTSYSTSSLLTESMSTLSVILLPPGGKLISECPSASHCVSVLQLYLF
jgi:hypothetical protein